MNKITFLIAFLLFNYFCSSQVSNNERYIYAIKLTQNKEYKKALGIFNNVELYVHSSDKSILLYNKGICYYFLGDIDSAYNCFLASSKLGKNDYLTYQAMGAVFERWENYTKAILYYQKAINLDRVHGYLSYKRLIYIYIQTYDEKSLIKALKLTNEAIEIFNMDPYFIMKRGEINYQLDKYEEAKKDLSYIIDHYSDSSSLKREALYYRGVSFYKLKLFKLLVF